MSRRAAALVAFVSRRGPCYPQVFACIYGRIGDVLATGAWRFCQASGGIMPESLEGVNTRARAIPTSPSASSRTGRLR